MQKTIISIVIAEILYMAIGFAWYSQYLFGPLWNRYSIASVAGQAPMTMLIFGTLLGFYIACLLAYSIKTLQLDSMGAARLVLAGWLLFMVPYALQGCIYGGVSFVIFAIDMGYNLVVYSLMAQVITYIK